MAVCAPSGAPARHALEAGRAILAQRYHVMDCGGVADGAATDARRLEALRRALVEENVRAVFVARGGYGLLRVAEQIPAGTARVIVGFSDVTVLLAWLWRRGVVGVHGPVVTQISRLPEEDRAALFRLLEDPAPPPPLVGRALAPGRGAGPLVGGNLTVLAHLCGTPLMPALAGAILLIEDVNEEPYRLDRALTHLRLAGALDGVAGVACGEFTGCGAPGDVDRTLLDRLGALGVPVVVDLPLGHGDANRAVPHGARATLDAASGVLRFEEGAVA